MLPRFESSSNGLNFLNLSSFASGSASFNFKRCINYTDENAKVVEKAHIIYL